MSQKIKMTFEVNGESRTIVVEPRTSLAEAIREECDLPGTRIGCDEGACGACTMLVDGEPVRSCLMFAVQAHGASVRTVEGLAEGGTLHPVQRAFMEEHAIQCGFCTAGFVMLAVGALERGVEVDDETLKALASANLCRCTGYQSILKALKAARAAVGDRAS